MPSAAAPAPAAPPPARTPPRAILSPTLDPWLTGALSIAVLVPLLLLGKTTPFARGTGVLFLTSALLNWPHFIASYRLLYTSRAAVLRHPVAAIYFPAALLAFAVYGLVRMGDSSTATSALLLVAGLYLARHYTGQTWGMMATFAHTSGFYFAPTERRLVRLGLDALMVWHILWAAAQSIGLVAPSWVAPTQRLYEQAGPLRALGFLLGALGLALMARRLGRLPPIRALIPWVAVQIWYVCLARDPDALLLVQPAHALQYLIFPLRIRQNRAAAEAGSAPSPRPALRFLARNQLVWTLVGLALFVGVREVYKVGYVEAGGLGPLPDTLGAVIAAFLNIHHYFIDGALYKLRNPEVRRDLFAHLDHPPAGAADATANGGVRAQREID